MKKAFKSLKTYILAAIGVVAVSCIAIIPYFVNRNTHYEKWPFEFIYLVYLFAGVVIFGVGFIWQDLYRASVRHKTKNWNGKLEESKINTAWSIFAPFFLAGLVCIVLGFIISLI